MPNRVHPPAAKHTVGGIEDGDARSDLLVVTVGLSFQGVAMARCDRVCPGEETMSSLARKGPPAESCDPPEGLSEALRESEEVVERHIGDPLRMQINRLNQCQEDRA